MPGFLAAPAPVSSEKIIDPATPNIRPRVEAAGVGTILATLESRAGVDFSPDRAPQGQPLLASALRELPADLAQHYLEPVMGSLHPRSSVREELRPRVRFWLYDATRPALPRGQGCVDLFVCRNLLIYLRLQIQERLLSPLRSAMSELSVPWGGGLANARGACNACTLGTSHTKFRSGAVRRRFRPQ
jgi:CheR methyltransferase, SAM binding domain